MHYTRPKFSLLGVDVKNQLVDIIKYKCKSVKTLTSSNPKGQFLNTEAF